jgi:Na+-translocating ferredoxin:NAD+ oxidoreductase RnfC subunit
MTIIESIEASGVIGCGGAGFPTGTKLGNNADTLIANGAECEPLLYSDYRAMEHDAQLMIRGAQLAAEACGAERIIVGIKEKNTELIERVSTVAKGSVDVIALEDVYPSGDEHMITHECTGRTTPQGGLPLDVGVLVQNVITLIQIARAVDSKEPVTHRPVTVAGAVREPMVFDAPIGITVGELLALCGGSTLDQYAILEGGTMMGFPVESGETVKKTTTGFIVLPPDNPALLDASVDIDRIALIARSVCDQCYYCTEMCPRRALGHAIEPHKIMRQIAFNLDVNKEATSFPHFCCDCGACSLYACPQLISPRRVIMWLKERTARPGIEETARFRPSPNLINQAKIPTKRLIMRLGLSQYDRPAFQYDKSLEPERVSIPLAMSTGEPSLPVVKPGDVVHRGDLVARKPGNGLGANHHASIRGKVVEVGKSIVIEAS